MSSVFFLDAARVCKPKESISSTLFKYGKPAPSINCSTLNYALEYLLQTHGAEPNINSCTMN